VYAICRVACNGCMSVCTIVVSLVDAHNAAGKLFTSAASAQV